MSTREKTTDQPQESAGCELSASAGSAILRCEEYKAKGWMMYIECFCDEWIIRIYDHDSRNPQAWGRGKTFVAAVESAEKELMATRKNFILPNDEMRDRHPSSSADNKPTK